MVKKIFTFLFCSILVNGISGQPKALTPDSINNYFKNRSGETNNIEGIWDVTSTLEYYHYDTLFDVVKSPGPLQIAILKKENIFQSYNLSGDPYETEFVLTDVKGVYLYRIYFPQANQHTISQAVISKIGQMEYTYDLPEWYFGVKPPSKSDEGLRIVNVLKWNKLANQNNKK